MTEGGTKSSESREENQNVSILRSRTGLTLHPTHAPKTERLGERCLTESQKCYEAMTFLNYFWTTITNNHHCDSYFYYFTTTNFFVILNFFRYFFLNTGTYKSIWGQFTVQVFLDSTSYFARKVVTMEHLCKSEI